MTRKAREAAGLPALKPNAAFNVKAEFFMSFLTLADVPTRQAARQLRRMAKRAGITEEELTELLQTQPGAA